MSGADEPLIRVVRGDPSPEELAAATAVLLELARRTPAAEEPAPARTAAPTWQRADRPAAPAWHRPALTTHRTAASWRQ